MPLYKNVSPWLLAAALAACGSSKSDGSSPANNGSQNNGANEVNSGENSGNGPGSNNSGTGNTGSTSGQNTGSTGATTGSTTAGSTTAGVPDAGPPPACAGVAAPDVPKLTLQKVVDGLSRLVHAAQPPASNDWYLVEQGGKVRVFTGGQIRSAAFLDLTSLYQDTNGNPRLGDYDERGLLGLAFAPDYATSGKFYVALTTLDPNEDYVYEYKRSSSDKFLADTSSKKEILKLPSSQDNHNGGTVKFGPDGMLYVGTGDGGGKCSSSQGYDAPQDVSKPYGKILRLDPSKSAPYAAAGNPFANDARVFHYGLRNPFRFGFDRATGDLYIGDVGQNNQEEVDFAAAGEKGLNFGWLPWEGLARSNTGTSNCPDEKLRDGSTHTPPIFAADRLGNTTPKFKDWASVIGGVVYRGSAIPSLAGVYFFGDWSGAYMAAIKRCATGFSPVTPVHNQCSSGESKACLDNGAAEDLGGITAIVEGNDGEIYIAGNGKVLYKVVQ